jgi:outer membrane protein assembly factor BamB
VVGEGRVWIAATRFNGDRAKTSILCYGADGSGSPPLRWQQDVCEAREPMTARRYQHHLLTLAGDKIVYCSHSGAVVALDARTGRRVWAMRYPSQGRPRPDDSLPRDLTPCVFADGRLYVAPADTDKLLCLDPATGAVLWERGDIDLVHLLGVGQGRLIFTTPNGLRAVSAVDGTDEGGWAQERDQDKPTPLGRGLLIGDFVLWPTVNGVFAVRQKDGQETYHPTLKRVLPKGNLLYANGCLVVAGRDVLSVFVAPAMRLEERERQAKEEPKSAAAHLELGRAEADAGLSQRALESFACAEHLAGPDNRHQGKWLRDRARAGRHRVLIDQASRALEAKRWDEAADLLDRAVAKEFPQPLRLDALTRLAAFQEAVGRPVQALTVWEKMQTEPDLANGQLLDEAGNPWTASAYASEQVERWLLENVSGLGVFIQRSNDSKRPQEEPRPSLPEFGLPLTESWRTALAPGERALPLAEPAGDLFLTANERRLTARCSATGKTCWSRALPFTPHWAATRDNAIWCGGPEGVACLHLDGRLIHWKLAAPAPPGAWPPSQPEPLGGFRLIAGRLFFLQGERRLYALDAATGKPLWNRPAPGAGFHLPYPEGRFFPNYHADDAVVLIQTTSGRRWLLDAATGHFLQDVPTAKEPWPQPPIALDEHRLCLPRDGHSVVLLDATTGRELWKYTLSGATTLSGELPRLAGGRNALLLLAPTNLGYFLQRLDPATGKRLWQQTQYLDFPGGDKPDVATWSFDTDAVYYVSGRLLCARSLTDGKLLWEQPLAGPEGRWQTMRCRDCLIAYPAEGRTARFQFRSLLGSVQWEVVRPPEEGPGRGFAVECREPKTGQMVQRLSFRDALPTLHVGLKEPAESLSAMTLVRIGEGKIIVAVPGQAWGRAKE